MARSVIRPHGWQSEREQRRDVVAIAVDRRVLTTLEKLNENVRISFNPLALFPGDINDSSISFYADLQRRDIGCVCGNFGRRTYG